MNKSYPEVNILISALDKTSVGVIITDGNKEGNPVIYVNQGFEKITGYSADEVIGSNCRMLQGPGTDPLEIAKISNGVKTQTSANAFLKNYRKDGSAFFNELTVDPVRDENNHLYFIGVQKDVTKERIYQMQLEKTLAEVDKLSTPIVPIKDNIAVLPLIGSLTDERFQKIAANVSAYLEDALEDYLIIDVSGLVDFNEKVTTTLVKFHTLLKLMGAELIITGILPKFAMLLIHDENKLASITTYNTMKEALKHF